MSQLPPGFVLDGAPASQPAYPGVIRGAPDPYKAEDQQMERNRDARAAASADRQAAAAERQADAADRAAAKDAAGTVDEKKLATLLTRIAGGFADITNTTARNPEAQEPGIVESVRGDLMPGGVMGIPARAIAGSDRRTVHDSQRDVLDALLTMGTGAAYNQEQLTGAMASHFPQYNDTPEEIAIKNQRMLRLIEAAKANAGPAWVNVEPAIAPYMKNLTPKDDAGAFDESGNYVGLTGSVTDDRPAEGAPPAGNPGGGNPDAAKLSAMDGDQSGLAGLSTLAVNGVTAGLYDEAAGIGGYLSAYLSGQGQDPTQAYYTNRDAAKLTVERARQAHPYLAGATEFVGGMAGAGAGMVNGVIPSLRQAAGSAGLYGGIAGYGSGTGAQDSIEKGAMMAGGNALLGGALHYAVPAASGYLANRAASRAPSGVNALAAAGRAEGVTVNRAMADPRLQNKVTGADASLAGGPRVQRDMSAIEGQIEGRVTDLGRGGAKLDKAQEGELYKEAATRAIAQTGKAAKAKYDRAEQLAGNAKVEPAQSLARVNQIITDLSETGNLNKAEIAYLEGLKGDLSKDLSVGALRRMRTTLRKRISKGELVFGEDEARVLSVMDSAADDIRAGLGAQGKQAAAQAFDAADKAYRARMDYIGGTLQKIIGKRGSTVSDEAVANKVISMANGKDAGGLRKFYASLTPEERTDVAATFADRIGRNSKDGFSVAHFLSQTNPDKLSPAALKTLFGPEGAQSIQNLRTLAVEVHRVTGAMNSRTSKTGVANDYRSWLFNLILGGAGGGAAGGTATAIGAAVAAGAVKGGRDVLTARAVMSPDLGKWLRQAPRTTNAAAINAHLARVPANVMDAKALQDYLRSAMAQSPASRAVAGEEEKPVRGEPPRRDRP